MNREVHVRFCERFRGETPLYLLDILPQDLRVNNTLLIDGIPQKVLAFTPNENEVDFKNNEYFKIFFEHWKYKTSYETYSDEQVDIVKINEELLLKIGAIKLDFKDFPSFNLLGTQINFINDLWIDYATRVEIKGLHHLQNIFYFRNSEELNVTCLTDR